MLNIKFPNVTPSLHVELRKRVNDYFATNNIQTTGNIKLYSKSIILLLAFILNYIFLLFVVKSTVVSIILCVAFGLLLASLGFNIMHDGAHGSFSKNGTINKLAASTLDFLGGSSFMWNIKHNILHHTYTNIEGLDDDIDAKPFLRLSVEQKRWKIHKYQHLYFWVFYCLLYFFWVFFSDFSKISNKKIGDTPIKKILKREYVYFFIMKITHIFFFIALPVYILGFVKFFIGYLIFSFVTGFMLSIVFQLAHTVEHTDFPVANIETGLLEDEFALHQIKTTANFATKSKLVSWYVGGLNFQVEHHLFPKISHIHYPKINKIVKQVCDEWGVKYIEYKNVLSAVKAHVTFLHKMGNATSTVA